jgi:pimeloyl-ACP methyl ester carboxylesterase
MSLFSHSVPDNAPAPLPRKGLLGVGLGLGAGLAGATVLGLRWLIRPPTKASIPETISPLVFSTRAFQSSRGQMIYHESGGGPEPTLVFVHGLGVGASSYEWSKVYSAFAQSRRVLAPDLIGFGESERPRNHLAAADYAESLAEFIRELCGEEAHPPIVVASGLGAGFAALMSARHPELIGRLILWMPTGHSETPLRLNLGSRIPTFNRFLYRNCLARRGAIRARFAKGGYLDPRAISAETVEVHALCAKQFQAEYGVYRWLRRQLNLNLEGCLAELKIPATLLWAGCAARKSLDRAARLVKINRLCALHLVPGAGPCAPMEAPGTMAAILQEELQSQLRVLKTAG